jgi:hypothetical protein
VVLFGISTGIKNEKLNFYSSNILNSPLVSVQIPKKSKKKIQKKFILGTCTGPNTLFLDFQIRGLPVLTPNKNQKKLFYCKKYRKREKNKFIK